MALLAGALVLLARPVAVPAQSATNLPRIGVLQSSPPSAVSHLMEAFRRGLRELGHVDGRTVVFEYRWAHGRLDALPGLAAELAALKVDVIYAPTTPSALAAKSATSRIPVVFAQVNDPVGSKLVANLSRPAGNITGVTTINLELIGKRLELLKELSRGGIVRVAMLFDPNDASNVLALKETERVTRILGMTLRPLPVKGPEDLPSAFAAIAAERIDGLTVAAGSLMNAHASRIVGLIATARVPAVYASGEFVDAGGLFSYAAVFSDAHYRAAAYVDRILRGSKPGDLPVEQMSRFELLINVRTARTLGIDIPMAIRQRADRVVD